MYPRRQFHHLMRSSRLICAQSENGTQHNNKGSSSYVRVNREWAQKGEGRQAGAESSGRGQTGNGQTMLQRWQQESMRDQPYHNIDAVKKRTDYGSGR